VGYNIVDIAGEIDAQLGSKIAASPDVIRVRTISL